MEVVSEKSTNRRIAREYKKLLKISYQDLNDNDVELIRDALDVAIDAHKEQYRKSGEPYIFHPLAVAKIAAEKIGLDSIGIASALLHDVVEDSKYTIEDIESRFGETVAKIVSGLTKISKLKKDKILSIQAENFRKMLLTLNDDVRVILIKIADRLHNMQTMSYMPQDKQTKISSESLYIYAPIAHRIGLYEIKSELEDLSLKYIEPEIYEEIDEELKKSSDQAIEDIPIDKKESGVSKGNPKHRSIKIKIIFVLLLVAGFLLSLEEKVQTKILEMINASSSRQSSFSLTSDYSKRDYCSAAQNKFSIIYLSDNRSTRNSYASR